MTAIHESITSLSGGTLAQHKEKFNLKVCYLMSVFGHLSDVQLFLVVVAPAAVVIRVPRKDGRWVGLVGWFVVCSHKTEAAVALPAALPLLLSFLAKNFWNGKTEATKRRGEERKKVSLLKRVVSYDGIRVDRWIKTNKLN
jgi:hypothetical protein